MEADDPLQCSICLELFKDPLTLECGHSFCQECIRKHWDREEASSSFSCPQCRATYDKRPEPKRNVSLFKMLPVVQEMKSRAPMPPVRAADAGAHGAPPTLCQRHHQELMLYCSTDSRCICCKCLLDCRQHDVHDLGEFIQQERKKLYNEMLASDCLQKHTEEEIVTWKSKIENIKGFHEKLVSGIIAKFEEVRKTVEECQILVVESADCEKNAAVTQAEEHVKVLQNHQQDLKKYQVEAETLLRSDGVVFLEGFPHRFQVMEAPESPNIQQCGNLQMEAVAKILPEVTWLLQLELPKLLHPETPRESSGIVDGISVTDAWYTPGTPRTAVTEQKPCLYTAPARFSILRTQLCKDYRDLKFDPETANRYIMISQGNSIATHKSLSRPVDVPDSPKRFNTWQVMCTQGFSEGSHYWEVGVSSFFVELGVAYESLNRSKDLKNTIGRNASSWSLQLRKMHHSVWYNNEETKLQSPMFAEVGVHLDMTAGSLTFYGVADGHLQRLHSFSCLFSEKVFPLFWIGEDVNVTIHTVPNAAVDAENEG